MTKDDVVFSQKFSLVVTRDDTVHALVAYFSISFTRTEKVITLSTGPFDAPTCWKQVFFYLKKPVEVKYNQLIKIEFKMDPKKKDTQVRIKLEHSFGTDLLCEQNDYLLQ